MRLKANVFKWSMHTRLKILGVLAGVICILAFISSGVGHATIDWIKWVLFSVEDKAQLRVAQVNVLWAQGTHYTTKTDVE